MIVQVFIIFLYYLFHHTLAQSATIKLGVLLPLTTGSTGDPFGRAWANISLEAAKALNNQSFIHGFNLQLVVLDTQDTQIGTVNAALQCAIVEKCVGVVGAADSEYSGLAQYVLQNFSIPQISPISTSTFLSDKSRFPTFLRTIPSDASEGPAIAKLIHHFNWTDVGLITGSDEYSDSLYQSFIAAADALKIKIVAKDFLESVKTDYHGAVQTLANAWVQIYVIFATGLEAEGILKEAKAQKILGKNFVWIGGDALIELNMTAYPKTKTNKQKQTNKNKQTNKQKIKRKKSFIIKTFPDDELLGNIVVAPAGIANTTLAQQYTEQMSKLNISVPYGGFVYDAVYTFANAFKTMLLNSTNSITHNVPWENSHLFLSTLLSSNFPGVTGPIRFDPNTGDRIVYGFDILNWQPNGELKRVAFLDSSTHFTKLAPIIWSDNTTKVPANYYKDFPEPPRALILFTVLAAFSLGAVIIIFLFGFCKSPATLWDYVTLHIPNMVGAIIGYTAVIVIVTGVSTAHCLAAPILMDLSLLLCGAVLTYKYIREFIEQYSDNTEKKYGSVVFVQLVFYGFFFVLLVLNIGALTGSFAANKPEVKPILLKEIYYEYRCNFKHHAIFIVPVTIGVLYLYAIVVTILKVIVNSGVAKLDVVRTRKTDIMNGVLHLGTLVVYVIGISVLAVSRPTQTQIDITICIVILVANLYAPLNLIAWHCSPNRATPGEAGTLLPRIVLKPPGLAEDFVTIGSTHNEFSTAELGNM